MRSVLHVNHTIVLEVRPVADADVMNVATHGAVAPNRGFFAEVHVAYYLSAWIHVRGWVNLRVNPTKWSNHGFWDSNIQPQNTTIMLNLHRMIRCSRHIASL